MPVVKEKYVYDVSVTVLHPLINKLKTVFPIPPQNPSHPQRLELTREKSSAVRSKQTLVGLFSRIAWYI